MVAVQVGQRRRDRDPTHNRRKALSPFSEKFNLFTSLHYRRKSNPLLTVEDFVAVAPQQSRI